jgi:hypothetical protein
MNKKVFLRIQVRTRDCPNPFKRFYRNTLVLVHLHLFAKLLSQSGLNIAYRMNKKAHTGSLIESERASSQSPKS